MWAKDSIQEQVCGLGIAVVSEYVCVCVYLCALTDLPHSNNSIRDEDEEDDKGLDKSSHSFFSFLKPSQHLRQSHTDRVQS